ncbi:hypothetical protein BC828DRAFT_388661 [Blastocladiella britannica]|nr:hypothetical protein BC828DRAFT_388661 [Blastocladiella britannica]
MYPIAQLLLSALVLVTLTTAQGNNGGNPCSAQRSRDACESKLLASDTPGAPQCYWAETACFLSDSCGTSCSKSGCGRCPTLPSLCYPATIPCPLQCSQYVTQAQCQSWSSTRAGASVCEWSSGANKCNAAGTLTAGNATATVVVGGSGATDGSSTSGTSSTLIPIALGTGAAVLVIGGLILVVVGRRRRQRGAKAKANNANNNPNPGATEHSLSRRSSGPSTRKYDAAPRHSTPSRSSSPAAPPAALAISGQHHTASPPTYASMPRSMSPGFSASAARSVPTMLVAPHVVQTKPSYDSLDSASSAALLPPLGSTSFGYAPSAIASALGGSGPETMVGRSYTPAGSIIGTTSRRPSTGAPSAVSTGARRPSLVASAVGGGGGGTSTVGLRDFASQNPAAAAAMASGPSLAERAAGAASPDFTASPTPRRGGGGSTTPPGLPSLPPLAAFGGVPLASSTASRSPAPPESVMTGSGATVAPVQQPQPSAWAARPSPMRQASVASLGTGPRTLSRHQSMAQSVAQSVTEGTMELEYVWPSTARMTVVSIADTDRELDSEVDSNATPGGHGEGRPSSFYAPTMLVPETPPASYDPWTSSSAIAPHQHQQHQHQAPMSVLSPTSEVQSSVSALSLPPPPLSASSVGPSVTMSSLLRGGGSRSEVGGGGGTILRSAIPPHMMSQPPQQTGGGQQRYKARGDSLA